MKLLVFAASHRQESHNRKLAKLTADHLQSKHITIDFAEYADFDMPMYNDATVSDKIIKEVTHNFCTRAANANGIVISSPEYNWSYPGSLKNIIDWISRLPANPLAGKTALLLSATPGSRGGILGLNHLKTPLEALQVYVFNKVFPLSESHGAFAANGELVDSKRKIALDTMLADYVTFTQSLTK